MIKLYSVQYAVGDDARKTVVPAVAEARQEWKRPESEGVAIVLTHRDVHLTIIISLQLVCFEMPSGMLKLHLVADISSVGKASARREPGHITFFEQLSYGASLADVKFHNTSGTGPVIEYLRHQKFGLIPADLLYAILDTKPEGDIGWDWSNMLPNDPGELHLRDEVTTHLAFAKAGADTRKVGIDVAADRDHGVETTIEKAKAVKKRFKQ